MASIFTYDPDPPRVSSPWSTSGSSTPQLTSPHSRGIVVRSRSGTNLNVSESACLSDYGITKLEPEPQEGPTEYKLHLLLRPRRLYTAMSTGHLVGGSYHSRASLSSSGPVQASYESTSKPSLARSSQSRQQRLQQLTTQLLWRLQQSSPFHSSTTASLVLPMLPEATPQLGVHSKPARLLPGLEESQGALYEIGVADDGTFVGLTHDELDESLTNLQAMAASLGCKVDVLRRVAVGHCEWADDDQTAGVDIVKVHSESLWVAEALVSPDLDLYRTTGPGSDSTAEAVCTGGPSTVTKNIVPTDNHSRTEQIRISITGPSTAGKSSLLGTLTTSALDNGRGKSRLSLLKHRHEIPSGVTSSVAQELIGYTVRSSGDGGVDVINYASGNVAGWDDIHAVSDGGRLAFISDLPGMTRYVKSTLRGLISWAPHYIVVCVPATSGDPSSVDARHADDDDLSAMDMSLSYLELCMTLETPVLVTITKMDLASRAGLRNTLAKVLSTLKVAGKTPAMLPVAPAASEQLSALHEISPSDTEVVSKMIDSADGSWTQTVPILLTSAVDGSGVGRMHALIRNLPIPSTPAARNISSGNESQQPVPPSTVFDVDEVFEIPLSKVYSGSSERTCTRRQGVVLCGLVRHGAVSIGDELLIGPVAVDSQGDRVTVRPAQRSRSEQFSKTPPPPEPLRTRPVSGEFPSPSYPAGSHSPKPGITTQYQWQRVRVVSVRNLRLPVRQLMTDQVGTVGVESTDPISGSEPPHLGKIRKGMVLVSCPLSASSGPPLYGGFVAAFPASEFSSTVSPPLLLGGNATAYVANVRTTVRITSVTLPGNEMISYPSSPTEPEFFTFDGDAVDRDGHATRTTTTGASATTTTPCAQGSANAGINQAVNSDSKENVTISFSFVTNVEWIEIGSRILLMPAASSVTFSSSTTSGGGASSMLTGLEGFVGRVCAVLPVETPS